jgi:hypothetical protein
MLLHGLKNYDMASVRNFDVCQPTTTYTSVHLVGLLFRYIL